MKIDKWQIMKKKIGKKIHLNNSKDFPASQLERPESLYLTVENDKSPIRKWK